MVERRSKKEMGWNGSGQKGAAPAQPKVTAKKPSPIRGLVAGCLVIILAAIAYFAFFSGSEKPQSEKSDKGRSRIKEVTPAAGPTNKVEKVPEKPKRLSKLGSPIPDGVEADEKGVLRYPGGARWLDPNRKVDKVRYETRYSRLFKRSCDRQIAGILETEPGERLFGTLMIPKNFKDEFLASLEDGYEYDKNDTEEDRKLKMAVYETKKDLKKRMDAGEDIVKIMKDSRAELEKLGAYREDLKQLVNEHIRDENASDDDVKDFVAAANKMLEKEGLPPIKNPSIMARQVMLKHQRERAAKEAAKAQESQTTQQENK